ncbi:MAG: multidrug transporter substrate-binding protein [Acidobacteria bacterium]|nr:multidrug transporter substrate-binding protein [Acidobacteriota bacterium]
MKLQTLVKLALQAIRKNKMRATLTMLGIIIGVAAVIVMVAIGSGARARIRSQINNLGTNMIVITPGSANAAGVCQGAQAFPTLSLADVDKIRAEGQYVTGVSPVVVSRSQVVAAQANWRTTINGVSTDYQNIRDWQTDDGGFFGDDDVRGQRAVAVIGKTVAQKLFGDSEPVGQDIQIAKSPFKVVGVLSAKGQNASGNDSDDIILVPYTTAATRLNGKNRIPQIVASAASEQQIPAAQDEIRGLVRESHRLTDSEEDDFTVRNQTDLAQAAESSTRVMTLLLAAIASISLLVGGIGIMNIMLVSVTERTREIGIRLAIGARGSDVLTQFLVESIVMGILGGVIGLLTGVIGAKVLGHFTGWETVISPLVMLIAIGFSGAVGIFFGYYPARRAAALNPIQALRYE